MHAMPDYAQEMAVTMTNLDNLEIDQLIYLGHGLYGLPGYGKRATARVISRESWPLSTVEWLIMTIRVQPSRRGRGLGARLLRRICAAADSRGIVLRLYVEELRPTGLCFDQLGAWYGRHGFTYVNPASPYEMVRQPKGGRHE
jgi:GNAT superfamily N-acetyltransferase